MCGRWRKLSTTVRLKKSFLSGTRWKNVVIKLMMAIVHNAVDHLQLVVTEVEALVKSNWFIMIVARILCIV